MFSFPPAARAGSLMWALPDGACDAASLTRRIEALGFAGVVLTGGISQLSSVTHEANHIQVIAEHAGAQSGAQRMTKLSADDATATSQLRAVLNGATAGVIEPGLLVFDADVPSRIATLMQAADAPARVQSGPVVRLGVALDIVMRPTTQKAWDAAEELVACERSPLSLASALIGTPGDIVERMNAYIALGVSCFVLTAPPERADYEEVAQTLLPLVRSAAPRAQKSPPMWHMPRHAPPAQARRA